MLKYKHFVAIVHPDNSIEYVTRVDNSTKMFFCEKGKPALPMSKTSAEDLMFCMVVNCHTAVVIKAPAFYTLMNKEAESTEN